MVHFSHLLLSFLLTASPLLTHAGTIVPPENLVTDGIPPIPASLAAQVGRYTEFRTATLLDWHPTHREILISTRFADTAQVHHVRFPGGARTQLTFFPDRVSAAAYQPKSGAYMILSKDKGGNEFNQSYRYDLATGTITLFTDGHARNSLGIWSRAGDRLLYSSTRRNGKDNDLYVIDPAAPQSDRIVATVDGGGWFPNDWSVDDRHVLVREYVSVNESYLWSFAVSTGEKTLLTPKGGAEKISYGHGKFSKDGMGLYVTTDKDAEFHRLAYVELATQRHTYLTDHLQWDVSEFALSEDGTLLAFLTNEAGMSVLHLLEVATGQEKPVPSLPVGIISGLKWHKNGRDLGWNLVSARSPTDVYSLDVQTGQVARWTLSETGGLNTETFAEPEFIRWQSFDARMISGVLYRPPARFTGKRPVLISIHGGPESQFRPGFLGRINYYLNELGVAVLFPNVRGSSGYGKTFVQLDNGYRREDAVRDIGALLDWTTTHPALDADRLMVAGASYGGYMALAVATHYNDRIRGALDIVGISNFVTFLERTESYRRDLRRAEYGDERDPNMRAYLLQIAPVHNAHKITKPLFIVQGKNDPRVPLSESEQMVATVKKNGGPVWYLMAKDEGHGFSKKKNVDFQFYATVAFIQEYLLQQAAP